MLGGVGMRKCRSAILSGRILAGGILAAGFLAFGSAAFAGPAQDSATAEAFVQSCVDTSLAILNNANLSKDEKDAQFRTFLLSITDLNHIADYTLGPVKRTADPGDLTAFEDAFRNYAIAAYETQFDKFSGQTLKVGKAVPLDKDITLVTTHLIDPNPRSNQQPLEVDFRIFGGPGKFLVGDVSVLNIDLAITVQDQFQAYLWQHKNDVKALTAEIERRTAKMAARDSVAGN
jgi:phospholipid transport system substrate-binding protein